MTVLLMVAIILALFSTANKVHAVSEPNLALNPSKTGYPQVTASYTCCGNNEDNPWNAVDGIYSFNRWTNWSSPNPTDSFTIDFGSAKAFNQVKLYIYNDAGGVQPPASYTIQYWDGLQWIDTTNQTKSPETPDAPRYTDTTTPNSILNTANFDTVSSSKLQVIFTNKSASSYSGIVELEVFLHQSADQIAATAIIEQIAQLPIQATVALTDKSAIAAARAAYNNLTVSQTSLVTNLSKLTAAEAAIATLEAAEAAKAADESAASAIITQIGQLPIQAAVALSDKTAITAARIAYNNLTVSQKSLVTNLSKLAAAEAAIVTLEAPGAKNVTVLSAFSNAEGNTITLKLSSVLDVTYGIQAAKFQVIANAVPVTVINAVYDSTDLSRQTIMLTFSSPVLLNATAVTLSLQSGAFKTNNNELNNAIHSRSVITFKNLDLSLDNRIGVDDVVQMIVNPALQIDVNQDGIFNREDILMLLGQISKYVR